MGDRSLRNKKPEVAPHGSQLGISTAQVSSPRLKGRQDSPVVLYDRVISLETLMSNVLSNQADMMKMLDKLLSDKNKKDNEEAAQKVLSSTMSETWKELQNKRRDAFTKHNRNQELAVLYEEWQSESPDYLPKKFRPMKIRGNNSEVAEIRMNEAKSSFRSEVKMLKAHANNHLERLSTINEQAKDMINRSSGEDQCRETLYEKWSKESHDAEENVREKWISKRTYFIKLKEDDLANGVPMEKTKVDYKQARANIKKDNNVPIEHKKQQKKDSPRFNAKGRQPKSNSQNNQQRSRQNSGSSNKSEGGNNKTENKNKKGNWKKKSKPYNGPNNDDRKQAGQPQSLNSDQNRTGAAPQSIPFLQAPYPFPPYPPLPYPMRSAW